MGESRLPAQLLRSRCNSGRGVPSAGVRLKGPCYTFESRSRYDSHRRLKCWTHGNKGPGRTSTSEGAVDSKNRSISGQDDQPRRPASLLPKLPPRYSSTRRRRSALAITETELRLIA